MDSIFDEDVDEVGGEIEAYCPSPRCKADTTHTIISMYEDEVRRVQCVVCGDVHAYRKPRGDSVEETAVAGVEAPRKRASLKPNWEQAMSRVPDADILNCRPYSIRDTYEEGDLVSHPKFDIGIVTELLPDNKVEILFKDEPRILVHNRGDLAQRMPGISEMPPPREAKKKKRVKKKEEPAAPVERRSGKDLVEAIDLARRAAQAKMDGSGGKPLIPPPKGKTTAKEAPKGEAKGKAPAKEPAKAAKGKEPAAPPAKKPAAPPPKKAAPAPKKPEKKPAAKPAAHGKKPAPAKKPAAKPAKKPAPAHGSGKKPAAKKAAPVKKPAKPAKKKK